MGEDKGNAADAGDAPDALNEHERAAGNAFGTPGEAPGEAAGEAPGELSKGQSSAAQRADGGPAPAGEGPAPAGEGPAPAGEGPAPAGEGPAPAGEGPAADGGIQAPDDESPAAAGAAQAPDVEDPTADGPAGLPMLPSAAAFELGAAYVDGLVETVKVLEAHEARLHALRAFVLSELCEHFRHEARDALEAAEAPTLAAAEIAAALNVSQRSGRAMVEDALALLDPGVAPVLEALRDGSLDRRRARAVVEHATVLPPGKDAAFAAAAVAIACPEDPNRAPSPGAFSRRLRRLAEDYHPEPLAARKAHATAFRRVDLEPTKDGMCWITAHLPLEVGAAIDTRLEAIARSLQGHGEGRGIGQLRADVFRDLLLASALPTDPPGPNAAQGVGGSGRVGSGRVGPGRVGSGRVGPGLAGSGLVGPGARYPSAGNPTAADSAAASSSPAGSAAVSSSPAGSAPTGSTAAGCGTTAGTGVAGGVRMEVIVTIPARTLTGESEAPAELLGYGPLDGPAARLLAAEAATWTTMWVDSGSGAPLALGRRRYTPSLAIRRFLGARDRSCMFPGCDKPGPATEADHTTPWSHGGMTDAANLALLCREHHRLKTLGHWKLKQLELGLADEDRATGPETPDPDTKVPRVPAPRGGVLEWTSPTGRKYVTHPETDAPPPF